MTKKLIASSERLVTELLLLRRIIEENEARIGGLLDIIKDRDATIAGAAVRSPGTNLMEATEPSERPREALSQLRDIGEWLANEGCSDLGAHADDLADSIARRYPESV